MVVTASKPSGVLGSVDADRTPRVQSVDRAMLLLRAVAVTTPEESTAARLAEQCGLNRATAWRILCTLETHGMVAVDRDSGRWSVGAAVVEMARTAGVDAIVASAHAAVEWLSLQTGETAALAVVRSGALTYVDEVASTARSWAATWSGRSVPLHATSTGKVLLAFGDADALPRLAEAELERFTDTTLTDPAQLLEEVAIARQRGFAVCRGEYRPTEWGVSAPVLDASGRPAAVLTIFGPGDRVTEARFGALGSLIRDAAAGVLHR